MAMVWLVIWQMVSLLVDNSILFTGPIETIMALICNVVDPWFIKGVLGTVFRIGVGLFLGICAGLFFAVLCKRYQRLEEFLQPFVSLLKTVPVASFVILFLIWWSSRYLAVAISFCVVFPQIYISTLEGLKSTDEKLLEMAKVFHMPAKNRLGYIYRPAVQPFLKSSIKISVGMAWKSGVAAEVISMGKDSIGGNLYLYKVGLDTAGVFALTVTIIFLSYLFEKCILCMLDRFMKWEPSAEFSHSTHNRKSAKDEVIQFYNVSKSFNGQLVLADESAIYKRGQKYIFSEPSGNGKTTRFRLICGLDNVDEGSINTFDSSITYMFQEDRLCEHYSAVKNLELVCGSTEKAILYLEKILPKECLEQPCKELSGGMKRRVALARAFSVSSDVVLLDEPYTGLDEDNREIVKTMIEEWGKDRCILIATHL